MGNFYSTQSLKLLEECDRCAYNKIVLERERPSIPQAGLSFALHDLLQARFDEYRASGETPPHLAPISAELYPESEQYRKFRKGYTWRGKHGNRLYGRLDEVVMRDGLVEALDIKGKKRRPDEEQIEDMVKLYRPQLNIYNYLLGKAGEKVGKQAHLLIAWLTGADDTHFSYDTMIVTIDTSVKYVNDLLRRGLEIAKMTTAPAGAKDCKWCEDREHAIQQRKKEDEKKAGEGEETKKDAPEGQ